MTIKEKDEAYIAHTYGRFPLVLKSGNGSYITDEEGKTYIDMGTGIAVNTFGIADPQWAEAVTKQVTTLPHTSNLYYSEPNVALAEMLCQKTGMKKVFFSNSGAEANECAIKAARKYAAEKKGNEYYYIVTLNNSFHGRTITTLAATGQEVFHKDFLPLTEGFLYAEPGDIEGLRTLLSTHHCAAIMMEVVQGEGGVRPLDPDYVKAVITLAEEFDLLIICDEVQIGNGRSGHLYGYMHYGIKPDIVTTAKGLGGGLPIGATLFGAKTENVLTPGTHGSTFGGNPVCCAGALSILSRLDDKMLEGVRERSAYIFSALQGADGIKEVSGLGLMIGILPCKDCQEVIDTCRQNGVLVIKAKNKVRLLPALNIPMDLLQKAVTVIKDACAN